MVECTCGKIVAGVVLGLTLVNGGMVGLELGGWNVDVVKALG